MFQDLEVLIVEDEAPLRDLYGEWMTAAGAAVRTAATAAEAETAWDDAVDVVLLDRRLPDGTGSEILGPWPADGRDCLVVMVSAVEPDFDIVSMGFDGYLTKPIGKEQLYETIRRHRTAADYDAVVSEYLTLVAKREMLEREKRQSELDRSDAYRRLCEDCARVRDRLADGPEGDVLVELLLREIGEDLALVVEYDDDEWAYRYMRDDFGGVVAGEWDTGAFVETFRAENTTNAKRRSLLGLEAHECSLHVVDSLVFVHVAQTGDSGVVCGFDSDVAPNITEFASVVAPYLDRDDDPEVTADTPG